jgi:hypothetical protein
MNNKKSNKNKINNKNNKNNKKTKKGSLFSDDNPKYTVKNTGFKDKNTAIKTIDDMHDRDITYQFQVINTMYNRCKEVQKKTKDSSRLLNLKKAEEVFKDWLDDYKKRNRKNEMWKYLPLDVVDNFEKLADYYDISRKARGLEKPVKSDIGFLPVYRKVKGETKALRTIPIKKSIPYGQTWDKHRNNYCKRRKSMFKSYGLYHKDGPLKGLPTVLHTNMLMWACTPEKNIDKIKKISKTIKKRLNSIKNV